MKKKTYKTPVTTAFYLTPHALLSGSPNMLNSTGDSLPVNTDYYEEDDINNAV